ncbi:head protein [Altererythrobacter marinus]|uniref:Head protein n=1 Tax=Pelagerythrobacter marinus TaxID=538382 RepID=A0ABW9UV21_9SPHN|nr:DUF5309 family protein [Pelagerythrobacter marinus]MXO67784.1 head protein [Pelagerythrobacter marinus]
MAVPTNTIQAVGRVGVREDLSDKIYELFPDDCPFQRSIGREDAKQVYHEWQTDALAAANAENKTLQGDDLANEARPNTVRQGNYTQIMKKVVGSSTTMEASRTAGRRSELAREVMKAGRELKTDAEKRFCGNYAAVPPASGTEGETAGALGFLVTNNDMGATGTAPTYSGGGTSGYVNAAAGNGTLRDLTETLFADTLADIWAAGGNPTMALMSMSLKRTAARFAGIAPQRHAVTSSAATIVAGAEVYDGDAGRVQLVPSRFTSTRDVLVIDPEYWAVAELDPMKTIDLAQTGLAKRKALYQEVALVCRNEAASGAIRDVQAVAA